MRSKFAFMLGGRVNIKALCMFFARYTASVVTPRSILLLNDRDRRCILGF
jgi:hypothetical protein